MFGTRSLIAAVVAGIAGTVANSLIVSALVGAPVMGLIFSFGREAVAILCAFLLIPLFARLPETQAWIAGIVTLTALPSLLAKTVFAADAPWTMVLGVNAVYAVTAVIVFRLIVKQTRHV